MDAAALEQDVRAELKRGYALRYNAMASILGVWGNELAAGSFDAEERRFELELTDEETARVLAAVQAEGEAWMGGTTWDERPAIRISVSNWSTSDADVRRTLASYAGQLAAR